MLQRSALFIASLIVLACLSSVQAEEENPIVTYVKTKVRDKDAPFGMTVQFKVKAGSEKEFEDAFKLCVAGTRKEPGCIAYYLNRDLEDPTKFLVFERFKSVSALEKHAQTAHVAELLKKVGPLLDGDPVPKVYGIASE